MQQQATVFTSDVGVIPTFKAGIHWGEVATGEIGSVKKDIVYSGDVLNTTARIVALCNQYNETLIISDSMNEELKQAAGFQFNYIASPVLRGKKNPIGIYGVKTVSCPDIILWLHQSHVKFPYRTVRAILFNMC